MTTVDVANVAVFDALAAEWWNPAGSSRLLHAINPVRLAYVRERATARFGLDHRSLTPLQGLSALDVGCGGGLVAEPLARMGATVTGLDASAQAIAVARAHAADAGLRLEYRQGEVDAVAAELPRAFDLVTCFETVEHVADRPSFLAALARLLAPGGLLLFSTPNRTALSWGVMIVGAERLARLLPRGTHDWRGFLTPDELTAALARAGLVVEETRGLSWRPLAGWTLGEDQRVNYLGSAVPAVR